MPVETKSWPARDPDAVLDYVYDIPLDDGDTVASYNVDALSGPAPASHSRNETAVTVWLSGGEGGDIGIYRISWSTSGGRTDEGLVTQLIVSNEAAALSGYDKPGPAHFLARYPAFASVPAGTIQYWLADAERSVDESWIEADYATALMALAAHNMAMGGLGSGAGAIPAGVTRFRSGSMDVAVSESAASASAKGGYASTRYGQEFAILQRRSFGGPRLAPA